ncbi:M23 family metallopeptidase [Pseudonocardia sp.]|uniref:M23 family metallopeptidase n=1 Tax=Pseudonocardia sp. TaxID=60912 RepID=UPI0031FCEDF9
MTTSRGMRSAVVLAAVLVACGTACTAPPPARGPASPAPVASPPIPVPGPTGPNEAPVLTPIAVFPLAEAAPVLGADDRVHLAYDLAIANQSSQDVHLRSVVTLDGSRADATLSTLRGDALARQFRPAGDSAGPTLRPGEYGYLFLDASLAPDAPLPTRLRHRFMVALQGAQAPEDVGPRDTDPPPPPAQDLEFTGVPVGVSAQPAVQLAPPLRGAKWVVGNGCCDTITPHRGATLSIDGTVRAPERFAIDFVQLDAADQLYSGPPINTASFAFFGVDVLSAADGTVVGVKDGLPEETPGKLPTGVTIETAGGNHAVVDIGNGRFAFYAHLQPGSLRVRVGDRVRAGDVIGLLGNSGNTDAPHLHFHVMDGPLPLQSNGLPFVFTAFTGQGVVGDVSVLTDTTSPVARVAPVDRSRLAGPHRAQLPLDLQVVDFG